MLSLLICIILTINALEILDAKNEVTIRGGLVDVVTDIEIDEADGLFVHCIHSNYTVSSVTLNANTILLRSDGKFKDANCFDVPTSNIQFTITTTLVHALRPSPTVIDQLQRQTLLLTLNPLLYSPYPVRRQVTHVNGKFIEHDLPAKYDAANKWLTFGPFHNTPIYSAATVSVFFASDDPLLSLTRYKRVVEISHWGYVNVREVVEVKSNSAAIRNEAFSRLDYSAGAQQAPSVESISVQIPKSASRLYFRDVIGNISTSHVGAGELKSKKLTLGFRFPLISGWQTQVEFGYQLPAHQCLRRVGGEYEFTGEFITLLFPHQVVEDFELNVVIPPHASGVRMEKLPFDVDSINVGEHVAYLDLAAPRSTLVVKARGLNPLHRLPIKVTYKHSSAFLAVKPISLSLILLLVFVSMMLMERLDLSILPAGKGGVDVHYCANSLRKVFDDVTSSALAMQERVNGFKRDKDEAVFEVHRQQFDEKIRAAKKKAASIEDELTNSETTGKMRTIIEDILTESSRARSQIVKLSEKIQQLCVNATKLVGTSMSAGEYCSFELKSIADRANIIKSIEDIAINL